MAAALVDREKHRPDDAIPLREHLEALLESEVKRLEGEIKRLDELRVTNRAAIDVMFGAADKAVQAALEAQKLDSARADEAQKIDTKRSDATAEKRFSELNDMRKAVATSTEVDALKDVVGLQQRSLDKLEAKLEGRAGGLKDYIGWIAFAVSVAGTVASLMVHR